MSGVLTVLILLTLVLIAAPGRAAAVPVPTPSSSASADCLAKAPGQVAWCMPWAVHVDNPPPGARSHWVTDCSKATDSAGRQECSAASVTLDVSPKPGTPSVLMDGPSTDGLAALVNCALLTGSWPGSGSGSGQSPWTLKLNTCSSHAASWAAQSYDPHPTVACGTVDVPCQVSKGAQEAVGAGIRSGIEGLIDLCVQGMVVLLSKLAAGVFTSTAISAPDKAFYTTYNSIAGVLILLIFIFFIVSTIINGLRINAGPGPLSTLGGLVRAILGVTFAGGLAYTIVAAWDQATVALLKHNAGTAFDGRQWSNAFTALAGDTATMFIALVLAIVALLGLLPLFIMMLFRGVLATGAALFGAWAMSGQAMSETRHWGRRWFWTVNALASSKFAIAGLWVYGSRSAYESDLWTALKAVLLIWLMVIAPYILLRLTAMWDGYLSDVNAHGLLAQANPLGLGANLIGGMRDGASGGGDGGGSDGAGPAADAASVMSTNTAALSTTPGRALGEGLGGAASGEEANGAADDAGTGSDGEKVGDPSAAAGAGRSDEEPDAGSDRPNADDAQGAEQGLRSARHDVAAGELTTPGDTTGADGSAPMIPQPGEQPSNPTDRASGAVPGIPAGGGTAVGDSNDAAADNGAPSGGHEPGTAAGGHDSAGPSSGSPPEAPGGAGSGGGGMSGGGAAAIAEVPIVPL